LPEDLQLKSKSYLKVSFYSTLAPCGMGPSQISCRLIRKPGHASEEVVSERNGDKSRFGRLRKQKILQRKRSRELRMALETQRQTAGAQATAKPA
jgi:hypothetical protein